MPQEDVRPERDPHLGVETFISGPHDLGPERRTPRAGLNRRRTDGIHEIRKESASCEPISADAWLADFRRIAGECGVPIIPAEQLGLEAIGNWEWKSEFLIPLKPGAEARPFLDEERGVVYKLFFLRDDGALGKKLIAQPSPHEPGEWEIGIADSNLFEILQKLAVIDEAGGHPTEIVGFLDSGDQLVVKQPAAEHFDSVGPTERAQAAGRMGSILVPPNIGISGELRILWGQGEAWMFGDLHPGNIMRDAEGNSVVIDALTGAVPLRLLSDYAEIRKAVADARNRAEGGGNGDDGQLDLF